MAASGFNTPTLNRSSDNLSEAFRSFKQYCELIFDGPFSKKSAKEQVTFILLWIGSRGCDIYNAWVWDTDEDRHKPEKVWKKFQNQSSLKRISSCPGTIFNNADRQLKKQLMTSFQGAE